MLSQMDDKASYQDTIRFELTLLRKEKEITYVQVTEKTEHKKSESVYIKKSLIMVEKLYKGLRLIQIYSQL